MNSSLNPSMLKYCWIVFSMSSCVRDHSFDVQPTSDLTAAGRQSGNILDLIDAVVMA